jgi:hypothetical protein
VLGNLKATQQRKGVDRAGGVDRSFERTSPFETQGKQDKREISPLRKPTIQLPQTELEASPVHNWITCACEIDPREISPLRKPMFARKRTKENT